MNNAQTLRAIQKATTYVLGHFHQVCQELGLRYAAYGGTAIGAIRHQGFIPWDDDADVLMPREDYEKFLTFAPTLLGSDFELLNPYTTPNYPTTFAVLGLKDTKFISLAAKDRKFQMPIGIDIFPLDNMPTSRAAFHRQCKQTWLWGRILFLQGATPSGIQLPYGLAPIANLIMKAAHNLLASSPIDSGKLIHHWTKAACRYRSHESLWLADHSTRAPAKWSAHIDELFPAVPLPFEDITVLVPKQYDRVLTRHFGNYMSPPPPHQRINHQPFSIDFGKHNFLTND